MVSRASLSKDAWRRVVAIFQPPAKDAQAERQRIGRGVALIQLMGGQQTGTAAHQWTHKNMEILPNNGDMTQLDCIDEAVNTWTYLTMLDRDGLMRLHRVSGLAHGGSLIALTMRNTAVIEKKTTGVPYAVDPWLASVVVERV